MTLTALVAFLLPLVVLAVALGGFRWLLEGRTGEPWQTLGALVLALLVATGVMLVIRFGSRQRRHK